MKTFVKICGLANAADVAAAVDAGANAVGFVFADSVRRVTPAEANDATTGLPTDVLRVAVMKHPDRDECRRILDVFEADVLQTDADDFATLDLPAGIQRWPVLREGEQATTYPDVFLYEGPRSGSGETVDWSRAAEISKFGRMLLAGGLAEDNVGEAIRTVRPWGVDVSSGVEAMPGCKDHELIRRFIGAVRAAEHE